MSLPHTITGIIGFMFFIGFITANVMDFGSSSPVTVEEFQKSVNSTETEYTGISFIDSLFNKGGKVVSSLSIMIRMASFTVEGLPTELSIFFILLNVTLLLLIIQFIRGVFEGIS